MYLNRLNYRSCIAAYAILGISLTLTAIFWNGIFLSTAAAQEALGTSTPDAPTATFNANAGTLGAIPDNSPATPRDVTFTVTGLSGPPTNVEVSHTYSPIHTWAGDINCTLIAPNGTTFVVYGRTGQVGTAAGDSSDLSGPYNFKDSAAGTNWWAAAFAAGAAAVVPPGDYRTTQSGPQPVNSTSPVTNLTAAFAGVANPNGTWTLRFTDNATGDTGSVSAASLTLTTATPQHVVDFNGDGKTDFSVGRNVGGNIVWYNYDGISPLPAGFTYSYFGLAASDFLTPEDFDGDGKTDIAVWRPGAGGVATFYILQSTTGTLRQDIFGQTGDDSAIVGDYDGDGKADPAVYRCPAFGAGDGQCNFYYRGSSSGTVTVFPWGFGENGDFFVNPGDFDGDGKYDFCIQRTNPILPAEGQFILRRSSDQGVEFINWGLSSDFIIPGDYDGDGKSDLCVRRTVGGFRHHYVLTRTGAGFFQQWGITGDNSAPGDYDGDGKTDFAVWRPSTTPGMSSFYVLQSGTGSFRGLPFGQNGDVATAGWSVH